MRGQCRLGTAMREKLDRGSGQQGHLETQLPGSPIFGLRITSSVALLKISLLTFTSAGPYTPARMEVSPGERAWRPHPCVSCPWGSLQGT